MPNTKILATSCTLLSNNITIFKKLMLVRNHITMYFGVGGNRRSLILLSFQLLILLNLVKKALEDKLLYLN